VLLVLIAEEESKSTKAFVCGLGLTQLISDAWKINHGFGRFDLVLCDGRTETVSLRRVERASWESDKVREARSDMGTQ